MKPLSAAVVRSRLYWYRVRAVCCVDTGDSVTADLDLGDKVSREVKVRLARIVAANLLESRNHLKLLLSGHPIALWSTHRHDGVLEAEVYLLVGNHALNVNDRMAEGGHARFLPPPKSS